MSVLSKKSLFSLSPWKLWGFLLTSTLIHLASLLSLQAFQVQNEAGRIALLLDLHAKGQGIVIGTSGITSLLSSLLEADGKLCVSYISARQNNTIYLERSFLAPENFSIANKLGATTTFQIRTAGFEIFGKVYPSNYLILTLSIFGLISSGIILFGYQFFRQLIASKAETQTAKARAELANQVAHDIRSPLIALEVLLEEDLDLPKDQLALVRSATTRIKDIANELISREFFQKNLHRVDSKPIPHLMSPLIESILTEKRIQYRSVNGLRIDSTLDSSSAFSFAEVNPIEFKRVISNLINNSVEAMNDGHINVKSSASKSHLYIVISDNGHGIPESVLSGLGQMGFSYGKDGVSAGSGLGLFHAKQATTKWGGDLEISSTIGVGTEVTIRLPLAKPPIWFCGEITIRDGGQVIVVDDEQSASLAWKHLLQNSNSKLITFSSANSFREWFQQQHTIEDSLFIFDYDLGAISGTDLIKEFSLEHSSILATSKAGDPDVLNAVAILGIRLIPKEMLKFVQINSPSASSNMGKTCVLLDDEASNQLAWKISARKLDIELLCFSNAEELFENLNKISVESALYIDLSLGKGSLSGLQVCKQLHSRGYRSIYLSTGYEKSTISVEPWLKGIVGKSPPWLGLKEA